MSDRPSSLQALFAEMKRRRVFRVMAVYGAVAFVILQVADIAFEPLGLPSWTITFVVVLSILGFPVAVVLAWAFEQTPEGIRRTERADPEEIEAIVAEPRSRRWPAGLAALAGIVLLVGGAWWMGQRAGESAAVERVSAEGAESVRSIAVLPLTTRALSEAGDGDGGASDVVLFADGMHDLLLTQLSRIADLHVTSRTSVEEFRDSEENIRDIASRLRARYVVEGAVDRVGDRVRVHIQLIDAESDGHVWAEQYDRTMTLDNLFDIQDDLTRRIASSLRATLTPETEERIVRRPTEDAEAFELYTRARHLYDRGSRPDLERAIALYEQATARDPQFATAHAGLAATHLRFAAFGFGPASEHLSRARTAVERALEIDPEHADALVARAMIAAADGDPERARADLERVVSLNPSHARARATLGGVLQGLGYEGRALDELEVARELDPLSADVASDYAWLLEANGRPREALGVMTEVLELHPDFEPAANAVAFLLASLGRRDEAVATLRQALRRDPASIFANEVLALMLFQAGAPDEAMEQIDRAVALTPDDYPTHGTRAELLMDAGRFADAVEALRTMVRLAPRNHLPRVQLADALMAIGDTAAALAQLDSATTLSPRGGTSFAVATELADAGRVDDAIAASRRRVEEHPASLDARIDHAEFLFATAPWASHRPEAAIPVFEEARRLSPDDGDLLTDYGTVLRNLGRPTESGEFARRLSALRPESPDAQRQLGWELLLGQRDVAGAGRAFRRSLELAPGDPTATWGLARVHAREGRPDSAVAALQQAIETCSWTMCGPYHEVRMAWLRALIGDEPGVRELLSHYEARTDHPRYGEWLPVLAAARAELGEIDRAFELLDEAYDRRSGKLLELKSEPWFAPLRDDPRFDELLERMELN